MNNDCVDYYLLPVPVVKRLSTVTQMNIPDDQTKQMKYKYISTQKIHRNYATEVAGLYYTIFIVYLRADIVFIGIILASSHEQAYKYTQTIVQLI